MKRILLILFVFVSMMIVSCNQEVTVDTATPETEAVDTTTTTSETPVDTVTPVEKPAE